jgi:nucleotide-binding universal stress UspA family protein
MYDRIVVPTDGGPGTEQVVAEAAGLAELSGAVLDAVYVVDAGATAGFDVGAAGETTAEALRTAGEEALAKVEQLAGDVPVETTLREGAPHREILAHVDETDADLVVMGTHGRTGLGRVVLGSVAERIVRLSDVPVMTVDVTEGGPAVRSAEAAEAVASDVLADTDRELAELRSEPYRESTTWIVPATTAGGEDVNVHVDAKTGQARVAELD